MRKIFLSTLMMIFLCSCNKKEENLLGLNEEAQEISMAATQEIEGKKFVRKAQVNMEVKEVYDATIFIEKTLKEMGGFVTISDYQSIVDSEKTYDLSDEKSMIVREYHSENLMEVRVPTDRLSDFLMTIHTKNIFLNGRRITAEDVSANIKLAQLEEKRLNQNKSNLQGLAPNTRNSEAINNNEKERNYQEIESLNFEDELKYSTINISLKEPKTKVAHIEVPNVKNQKIEYQSNFWYELSNAFYDGFYIFQRLILFLTNLWLFILIGFLGFISWKKRRKIEEYFKKK